MSNVQILFKNNAVAQLEISCNAIATTLTLGTGQGALYPAPGANQAFYITVQSGNNFEEMLCTNNTGDVLTVARGVDGTTAQAFPIGAIVEMRVTAAVLNTMAQQAVANAGVLLNVQVFDPTAPYTFTYTPTAGTALVVVEIVGAGGAGGGADVTTSSQVSMGSGGCSGAYAKTFLATGFAGASVTPGVGGAAAAGAAGGDGGSSAFGGIVVPGGTGGAHAAAAAAPLVIDAPYPPSGYPTGPVNVIRTIGNSGAPSFAISSTQASAGLGGPSPIGGNGQPGGGGRGVVNFPSSATALSGAPGNSGIVVVWEYGAPP